MLVIPSTKEEIGRLLASKSSLGALQASEKPV